MVKVQVGFIGMLMLVGIAFSNAAKAQIKWLSFEQMEEAYQQKPKPILVDLYTDWCGWCKQMDKVTYGNKYVTAYINEHYYAVKYNAESKKEIRFNAQTYRYNTNYKVNDLAVYLSFGELSYPNSIFLSSPDAKPAPLPGFLTVKEFEAPVRYFVERKNEGESFVDFNARLQQQWR